MFPLSKGRTVRHAMRVSAFCEAFIRKELAMAIYHFSIKTIGRSNGKSAVAAAAYRSGSKLKDLETGTTKNYTRKSEVAYSEILLPVNAPNEYADRETLWNEVQKIEKNSNARFAREIEIALPKELPLDENIKLIKEFCQKQFVDEGMVADINIHNKAENPHAHVMLTTRSFTKDGKWAAKERKTYALDEQGNKIPVLDKNGNQKIEAKGGRRLWERISVPITDWNNLDKPEKWRAAWADAINEKLQYKAVDHRSYAEQGIDKIPTIHLGVAAAAMEKRGIATEKGNHNRKVALANAQILQKRAELAAVAKEIDALRKANQFVIIPVQTLINKVPSTSRSYIHLYRIRVNDRKACVAVPADIAEAITKKQPLTKEQLNTVEAISAIARKQQQRDERSLSR